MCKASWCWIIFCGLLFCAASSSYGSVLNEDMIDKDLKYQDFRVSDDGFITGMVVNTSNRLRPAVKLDMWITNFAETRIYWRKSLYLGDLPPGMKYEVKERADGSVDGSQKLQFKFRIPQEGNFRNK